MYDLIIIGGGPAGYVAAEHAAKLGKKVMLCEKENLGGVCLNVGCIPTKSLLYGAKLYDHARHSEVFGVRTTGVEYDYAAAQTRKMQVIETLRKGVAGLMKRGKIEVCSGAATLKSATEVVVNDETFSAQNILLCTGSRPALPPIPGLNDNPKVVTSTGLLGQESLAEHLCIIGGGVIGTEFAAYYATIGRQVTVIEMLPQICGATDPDLAKLLQRRLEKRGVNFQLGATVESIADGTISFVDAKGEKQAVTADLILAAMGRVPNIEDLGLEAAGVDFSRTGIRVDDHARTNLPNIYAAGDVTGRWQLAHFATRQGTVAVHNMFGGAEICRENAIPAVVYTDPEIACVGLTEAQAREKGLAVRTAKLPLGASGRYVAETDGERGIIKVVVGEAQGEILGVQMIGPYASEMIGAAVTMIESELRVKEVSELVFPHPTVAEVMHDVMLQL